MFYKFEESKSNSFHSSEEAMEAIKYANELMSQAIAYLSNMGVNKPSMKVVGKPIEISMKNADMAAGRLFKGYANNDRYYADGAYGQSIKQADDGHYVMAKKYSFGQLPVGEASRVYDRIVTDHTRVIHSWEGDDCGVFITIDGDTTIINITHDSFNEIMETVINRTESIQSYLRLALNDSRRTTEEKNIAEKILAYIDWKTQQ